MAFTYIIIFLIGYIFTEVVISTMKDSDNFKFEASDFLPILEKQFAAGCGVNLTVTGNSMRPFLADKRDTAYLIAFGGNAKKGDILLFRRADNSLVLHRVQKITPDGIYFAGDAQTFIEGPVSFDKITAECNAVVRKGKLITEKNIIWRFFSKIWIRIIRLRPLMFSLYIKLKKNN